jgi:hypothetical protein
MLTMLAQWLAWLQVYWVETVFFLVVATPLLWFSVQAWMRRRNEHSLANRRAEQLLRERLTPSEYRQLVKFGYLDIPSKLDPYRQYRIPRSRSRVQVLHTCLVGTTTLSRKVAELCVIATDPIPDADMVLTHKLMIEADESHYLTIANWSRPPHECWYREPAH